jgi:hypothetical protein
MQAEKFVVLVDDVPVEFDKPNVSGEELMAKTGGQQLVELLDDGSQRTVEPGNAFDLEPGKQFKHPPHFKRG